MRPFLVPGTNSLPNSAMTASRAASAAAARASTSGARLYSAAANLAKACRATAYRAYPFTARSGCLAATAITNASDAACSG